MTTSKPEIGKLLKEAYEYWMRTLPYQFLFTLTYLSVMMFAGAFAFRYYGLFAEVNKFSGLMYTDFQLFITKYEALMQTENAISFTMAILVMKAVMFPLNIGFMKIYRKIDLGENLETGDLFAGFRGHYFFLFLIYSLFWNMVNNLLLIFPPLSFLWMAGALFVPALVFFKGFHFLKAYKMSGQVFQKNFVLIFIAVLVSILFSYSGLIMFFFGIFITFPFWNAMIYVLYKHLIGDFEE